MSAIVGIFHRDSAPVDRLELETMSERAAGWGPDGTGLWLAGPIGLAHRMLHTTPESLGEVYPMAHAEHRLVITADARIDNRSEVIGALGLTASEGALSSDGALILLAYRSWGELCVERLLGDFAFAIWDGEKNQLFCARDPLGVRPFFYYCSPQSFLFATDIKCLLACPEVPRRLDESVLAEYFAMILDERVCTLYQGIRRLSAAHCLIVNPSAMRTRAYWSLDNMRELKLGSDTEYASAFQEVFTRAVSCRLRSAFPVGSMLSGGLDSSAVTCVARNIVAAEGRGPLPTFSAVFSAMADPVHSGQDRPHMEAVVAQGGLEPNYVRADQISPLLEFLWEGAEAIPAASAYMDWRIFDAAQAAGVRVLLSGHDGDTVVYYGYEYLAELVRTGSLRRLLHEARALSRKTGAKRRELIWQFGLRPFMPLAAMRAAAAWHGDDQPPWDARSVINPNFAARAGLIDRIRARQRSERAARTVREGHAHNLLAYNIPWVMESLAQLAAHFRLDPRYPFFDRRMVEFCLSLPGEQIFRDGWDRWIMRKAMAGIIPAEIQWRTGKGTNAPNFNRKLIEFGRDQVDAACSHMAEYISDYVNTPALLEANRRYSADPLRQPNEAFSVFWAVVLILWLRASGLAAETNPGIP